MIIMLIGHAIYFAFSGGNQNACNNVTHACNGITDNVGRPLELD